MYKLLIVDLETGETSLDKEVNSVVVGISEPGDECSGFVRHSGELLEAAYAALSALEAIDGLLKKEPYIKLPVDTIREKMKEGENEWCLNS